MSDSTEPEVENILDHLEQAAVKVKDLAEVHLPAIAEFLQRVRVNPLVTAFASVIPGEVGVDAQAVLNGLLPILGALGAKGLAEAPAAVPGMTRDDGKDAGKDPWS